MNMELLWRCETKLNKDATHLHVKVFHLFKKSVVSLRYEGIVYTKSLMWGST